MNLSFCLISLIFYSNYVAAQIPPDCSTAANGAQFPHNVTCHNFYVCIFNVAVEKLCPYGLHFDASHNLCITPNEIISGKCSLKEICKGKPDGYQFAHPNCDKFYLCHHDEAILKECRKPLHFDYNDKSCKPPQQIVGPCHVPQGLCSTAQDGTMIAHPDKTKFYFCYEKEARIVDCGTGLTFNEAKQFCERPGLAKNHIFPCNGRKLYE